jgi:fibronectin-binding autotransporter adhesin
MPDKKLSRWITTRTGLVALVLIVPLTITLWTAFAATRTWVGGGGLGNTNWTTSANWAGNAPPVAGDNVVFPASPGGLATNDFAAGTTFGKLTMNGGYQLTGNSAVFNAGIEASAGIIALASIRTFRVANPTDDTGFLIAGALDNNNGILTFDGAGDIVVSGLITGNTSVSTDSDLTGTVTLNGNNTYTGLTQLHGGTLRINGSQSQSSVSLLGGVLTGGGLT